jgi:hypothetical protein
VPLARDRELKIELPVQAAQARININILPAQSGALSTQLCDPGIWCIVALMLASWLSRCSNRLAMVDVSGPPSGARVAPAVSRGVDATPWPGNRGERLPENEDIGDDASAAAQRATRLERSRAVAAEHAAQCTWLCPDSTWSWGCIAARMDTRSASSLSNSTLISAASTESEASAECAEDADGA